MRRKTIVLIVAASIFTISSFGVAGSNEKPLLDSLIGSEVFLVSSFIDLYYSDDFNSF